MFAEADLPQIPSGPTLRRGQIDGRVGVLRRVLGILKDLEDSADDGSLFFDESLERALRRFQRRHGLKVDGILGRESLSNLNRSMSERIRQIEINLERWRWLPHGLGSRYILVNIADFRLNVIEFGRSILDMRVVVGSDYRKTPVFTETIKYIVINPYWFVPFSIAVKDKLPLIRKDPSYLSKNGYRVFTGWEDDAQEVPPESIDWSRITRSNFRYRLRQDPGPQNALGRIKFMFPNRFSVYLHDTPQKPLFEKTVRTFSSGCIRVENPVELAAYVLQEDPHWDRQRIESAISQGKRRTINLKNPIPVHLLYWTAWVEPDGTVHFREDVYERDQSLDRALKEAPLKSGIQVGGFYQ
jgi:murein L,D-transpeptidase YcbB/YkuD